MYTIEIKIWHENKYDSPDEIHHVGVYYSEEAAHTDIEAIRLKIMMCGYKRFAMEVMEIKTKN